MAAHPVRDTDGGPGDEATDTGTRRYASPQIIERRKRILDEALALIGEVGADAFTVRDLGRRAGVSVTTIYNIFGDKEAVVGLALREFDAGIRLSLPNSPLRLDQFIDNIARTTEITLAHRGYALALADLYFSRSLSPSLYETMRSFPLHILSHWLWIARRDDLYNDLLAIEDAENRFANLEWASIKDWGAGRISDAALGATRARSFLMIVLIVGKAPVAAEAARLLEALRG